jgi:hypothetical protein
MAGWTTIGTSKQSDKILIQIYDGQRKSIEQDNPQPEHLVWKANHQEHEVRGGSQLGPPLRRDARAGALEDYPDLEEDDIRACLAFAAKLLSIKSIASQARLLGRRLSYTAPESATTKKTIALFHYR